MTEEQINYMANRFLGWKLPDAFNPDGGVSFKAKYHNGTVEGGRHKPAGTNLFSADQAREMVQYMAVGVPTDNSEVIIKSLADGIAEVAEHLGCERDAQSILFTLREHEGSPDQSEDSSTPESADKLKEACQEAIDAWMYDCLSEPDERHDIAGPVIELDPRWILEAFAEGVNFALNTRPDTGVKLDLKWHDGYLIYNDINIGEVDIDHDLTWYYRLGLDNKIGRFSVASDAEQALEQAAQEWLSPKPKSQEVKP